MQKFTCTDGCADGAEIYTWVASLGLTQRGLLVAVSDKSQANELVVVGVKITGTASGYTMYSSNLTNILYAYVNNSTSDVRWIRAGAQFYWLPNEFESAT